jgi:O-glycosyl hydrolase
LILQLLQTVSVVLAMAVAAGTIRGRGSEKTATLTKMQVDIEYIKQRIDGFDKQALRISELEACCKTITKRLDDHLWQEHGCKREGERE